METNENKKNQYILLIQDFHRKNNRVPRRREFENICQAVTREFGSWNNAIRRAGFEVVRDFHPTKARMKNSLLEFYTKHKRAPLTKECNKANGLYDPQTYIKFLEVANWSAVLEKVGLDRFLQYSKLTKNKERAYEEIASLVKKGKVTKSLDYKRLAKAKGLPSLAFIRTEYGGWENLLKTIGLRKVLTKETIAKAVKECYKKSGKSPTIPILAQQLRTTADRILGITGSYNKFLAELGFPLNKRLYERNKLTAEELKRLYIDFSRRNGHVNGASLKAVNESGELPVANVFIRKFGSMNDLRRVCGFIAVNDNHQYSKDEVMELLRKKYLLFRRPLTMKEMVADSDLPSVSTIRRYLELHSLKDIWELVRDSVQSSSTK